ncbi:hypothetical protein ISR92_03785 [Patescibacteria group bacterium]|nr:hypothetical protein [Patescibacteria group bacterium]
MATKKTTKPKAKAIKVTVTKSRPKAKTKAKPVETSEIQQPTSLLTSQSIPKVYRKIIIFSILLVIVLAVLVVHYSLAKAFITITPEYSDHDISFSAQIVDPEQSDLNIEEKDYLIGRKLETVLTKSGTFTPPTSITQGDKASGEITLINNYSKEQTLVATTRLLAANGKLFRLTKTVTVPAGSKLTAIARADETGDEYLIAATKFTIPGLWEGLQDKIYAESTGAMKMQEETHHLITAETINAAITSLKDQILIDAIAQFQPQLSGNEYINNDALIVQEIRRSTSANIGEDTESFDVELELSIKTITYDEQKLLTKIENDINVLAEQNQGLINFSNNDINVSISENEEVLNGIIGVIQGKYKIQLANPNIDMEQIKGKSPDEATQYLTNLSGVLSADISLSPFWLTNIPDLDNHIKVILNK